MECDYDIAEMSFPISRKQQYPICPKCHSNEDVDIVIGDEDTELNENMVIYSD